MMKRRSKAGGVWGRTVKKLSAVFPENHFLQTTEYRIRSDRVPPSFHGFRIVQLSDLHGFSFGRGNSRLIRKIEAANPNVVVMTGDMTDRFDRNFDEIFGLSEKLCEKYPVYYIVGNHEQEKAGPTLRELLDGLDRRGVCVLNNSQTELQREKERIRFYGIRVPLKCYRHRRPSPFPADKVQKAAGGCDGRYFSVLLAHNPFYFESYAEWGADLVLSGHVHGGMIRLPFLGGLLSPERRFFPKYSGGRYRSERFRAEMIVSRGLAGGARIHNLPQIVVAELSHLPAIGK